MDLRVRLLWLRGFREWGFRVLGLRGLEFQGSWVSEFSFLGVRAT